MLFLPRNASWEALKEANDYLRKRLKRSEAAESSGSSDEGRELARSEEQAIQALPTPKLEADGLKIAHPPRL